jgi:hypothetical protein
MDTVCIICLSGKAVGMFRKVTIRAVGVQTGNNNFLDMGLRVKRIGNQQWSAMQQSISFPR